MAEVALPPIRVGFAYSADVNFPASFLLAGESARAKLRRYAGAPAADATFTSARVGDTITLSLTAAQTSSLEPATYLAELVLYTVATPGVNEQPLTDNIYSIEVQPSPSV